jgi:outer membrane protein assembly factor BamB
MSTMITLEKTGQFHDNIYFNRYYRTNQEYSDFDFYTKTMIDHHSLSVNDKCVSEPRNPDVDPSYDEVGTVIDDALMDSCWPMKSQNRHHTGLSPYNTVDNNGMVKWKYKVDVDIKTGFAIDNEGVLYFGGGYNDIPWYVFALYPNGTLKWKFKTNGIVWSTPALAADGTVYIGTYDAKLYALNANGTLKWETSCGESISSSPAIGKDGTIYLGTFDGKNHGGYIIAMKPNGTIKWRYETGYHVVSDPAIADDGTIYIGSGDSYLYAINPDGMLKWRFKTGDWVKSHPAIGMDGTVYFDSFDDYLYALNSDGSLKWKYHDVGDGSAGAAIDEEGIIYIGGRRLSALYPNGTLKWHYTFGTGKHSGHSSPAISADGTIYIGVSTEDEKGGYIYAINRNGTLKWQKKIANEECLSSPTIDTQGNVYIGSSSRYSNTGEPYGELYAFGRNDANQPPEAPVITGTNFGRVNTPYLFNFTVYDPELDDIELFVDWGDGNSTGWLGPYDSDTVISLSHSWSERGNYQVKAKARDTFDGSESKWSTFSVIISKNKAINTPMFLQKFIQRFPFFEKY